VKSGAFPSEQESFFMDKSSRPVAPKATVSAIALGGDCGPGPLTPIDGEAEAASEAASEDGAVYSTVKKD
jgi:hypothetical protein